jgi:uncharacterized membrane protein YdfJ with MMPL/SSD domain
MTRRLARLADFAYRNRGRMVAAWIGAAALIIFLGARYAGEYEADYNTPGSESKAASELTERAFGGYSGQEVLVVWKDPNGAESPAARKRVDAFLAEVEGIEDIEPATATRVSQDGTIASTSLPLTVPGWEVPKEDGEKLVEAAEDNSVGGLEIELAGDPIYRAQEGASPEGIGFLAAAVVLLIAFGSLVAAGLPLAIALIGFGISAGGLIALLANVIDVPDWTLAVAGLIGIGVGIDYALLVLTRFRSAMNAGKDRHDAVVEAVTTAGRSVIIAGGTVVIAVLGLFLTGLPYMYGVAISASLTVLVMMSAAVTLLPALLSLLGPRVDRLRIPLLGRSLESEGDGRESPAARWSHTVQRRPWLAAIAATALLLVLAAPALGMRLGFPDAGNDPPDTMTRKSYDLLSEGFGPGANGPLVIAAELPDRSAQGEIDSLAQRLRGEEGVAFVAQPQISQSGDAAIVTVTPTTSPQDEATTDLVKHLRDTVRVHRRSHTRVRARRRRSLLPAPPGRVPLTADLAQGGCDEPALGQRRLWRDDAGRPGRGGRPADRDRPRGADRPLHAGDDVRDPLRPLDGLRGLPGIPHPRGVLEDRRHAQRRRRRAGEDGTGDHRRGGDHGRRLPRLRRLARSVPQALRDRPRRSDLPRRHGRPNGPRAGGHAAARPPQLVDPELAGAHPAPTRRRARDGGSGGQGVGTERQEV